MIMDRLSNNEALLSCAILHTMVHNVHNVALIDLMVVLCTDRAIRQRIPRYSTYSDFIRGESRFENALNRKFKEMQPTIINAMTMLLMSGMINNLEDNEVDLSWEGSRLAFESADINSMAAKEVFLASDHLASLIADMDTACLYNDLRIVL